MIRRPRDDPDAMDEDPAPVSTHPALLNHRIVFRRMAWTLMTANVDPSDSVAILDTSPDLRATIVRRFIRDLVRVPYFLSNSLTNMSQRELIPYDSPVLGERMPRAVMHSMSAFALTLEMAPPADWLRWMMWGDGFPEHFHPVSVKRRLFTLRAFLD